MRGREVPRRLWAHVRPRELTIRDYGSLEGR